jgi:hypothetical protein
MKSCSKLKRRVRVSTRRIVVSDLMQSGYVYEISERAGRSFHSDFKPHLSPKEMLELGVFGGKYMTDCQDEFPDEWFSRARLSPDKSDPEINLFGVAASQSLSEWRKKGWIWDDDPRGWFQWYCRYYVGRRCVDDERQVKRWKAMTRHIAQIKKNCERYEFDCRPRQRQALLHWAYDPRNF